MIPSATELGHNVGGKKSGIASGNIDIYIVSPQETVQNAVKTNRLICGNC